MKKPAGFRFPAGYFLGWTLWMATNMIWWTSCSPNKTAPDDFHPTTGNGDLSVQSQEPVADPVFQMIHRDIPIRSYFEYLDSLVAVYDSLLSFPVSEHLIVRANPWLIDTLAETDYYRLMEKGIFVYDPQALIVLHRGDSLLIPDSLTAVELLKKMAETHLDLNIPEYKLRIFEGNRLLYTFPVRVGRNEKKYLAMAGRTVDLRTRPGTGFIWRINRKPVFINPSDNKPYYETRRDDGKRTKLPRIPWLEPELDGHRYGHLIHPTTNPETLGKAYSNGCIGTREADAWRIYYHAPVGTKVVVRYELTVVDETGDTLHLKNIYPGMKGLTKAQIAALAKEEDAPDCCLCHLEE